MLHTFMYTCSRLSTVLNTLWYLQHCNHVNNKNIFEIYADYVICYQRIPNTIATDQGIPHDYESVMHYPPFALFNRSIIVMHPLHVDTESIGSALTPTRYDYLHIKLLYCGGMCCERVHGCLYILGAWFEVNFLKMHCVVVAADTFACLITRHLIYYYIAHWQDTVLPWNQV